MAYDVHTVTAAGATLIAAATASNKLILAGCDATTTTVTQADAIATVNRPASPLSTTTRCSLEGATDNHVFIRVVFVAGESAGGDAKTLYLFGHSASDTTTEKVLAVISSQDGFHLPETGDVANTFSVLFDITYAVESGAIETIDSSLYATEAEFEALNERAVTTHKLGDMSVGDDQTILGKKRFSTKIICEDITNKIAESQFTGGISTKGFYNEDENKDGVRIGFFDPSVASDNRRWNAYVEVESSGTPGSGEHSNNSVGLTSFGDGNEEVNAFLAVGNSDGEPHVFIRTSHEDNGQRITQDVGIGWSSNHFTSSSYVSNSLTNRAEIYQNPTEIEIKSSNSAGTKSSIIHSEMTSVTVDGTTYECGHSYMSASGGIGSSGSIDISSDETGWPVVDISCGDSEIKVNDAGINLITSNNSNYTTISSASNSVGGTIQFKAHSDTNGQYTNTGTFYLSTNQAYINVTGDSQYTKANVTLSPDSSTGIILSSYDNTKGNAELKFHYLRTNGSKYVYTLESGTGDPNCEYIIGDTNNKFSAVYADNFYGTASMAYTDTLNNIISSSYAVYNSFSIQGSSSYLQVSNGAGVHTTFDLFPIVTNCIRGSGSYGQLGLFAYLGTTNVPSGTVVNGDVLQPISLGTNEAITTSPQSCTLSIYTMQPLPSTQKWVLLTPTHLIVSGGVCIVLAMNVPA